MFNLIKFWNNYSFEILLSISIFIILVSILLRLGKKGSWSKYYIYGDINKIKINKKEKKRDSKGEIECRKVLESIFRKPFSKCRPDFLKNPITSELDSNNLELDCYNDELKLAVEYNGIQHYKYIPFFHKTKDSYYNQKYRDYLKREMCEKNGITLIEVPYTVKNEDIKTFIINKLNNNKWKEKMK